MSRVLLLECLVFVAVVMLMCCARIGQINRTLDQNGKALDALEQAVKELREATKKP